jgi:hypothetical protein
VAGAVTGQPGCPCSVCDEDEEFEVSETETKGLQIHAPVDVPEISTASSLRSRFRVLRTGVVEWVDPKTGQVEVDFLSWRDRWSIFGIHSYDWSWVRRFGAQRCGCTKNPLTRKTVLISGDCTRSCGRATPFMKIWKTRNPSLGAHTWQGCCARNTYAVIWAPRLRSWVRVVWFSSDEIVVLTLDNKVLTP